MVGLAETNIVVVMVGLLVMVGLAETECLVGAWCLRETEAFVKMVACA